MMGANKQDKWSGVRRGCITISWDFMAGNPTHVIQPWIRIRCKEVMEPPKRCSESFIWGQCAYVERQRRVGAANAITVYHLIPQNHKCSRRTQHSPWSFFDHQRKRLIKMLDNKRKLEQLDGVAGQNVRRSVKMHISRVVCDTCEIMSRWFLMEIGKPIRQGKE